MITFNCKFFVLYTISFESCVCAPFPYFGNVDMLASSHTESFLHLDGNKETAIDLPGGVVAKDPIEKRVWNNKIYINVPDDMFVTCKSEEVTEKICSPLQTLESGYTVKSEPMSTSEIPSTPVKSSSSENPSTPVKSSSSENPSTPVKSSSSENPSTPVKSNSSENPSSPVKSNCSSLEMPSSTAELSTPQLPSTSQFSGLSRLIFKKALHKAIIKSTKQTTISSPSKTITFASVTAQSRR